MIGSSDNVPAGCGFVTFGYPASAGERREAPKRAGCGDGQTARRLMLEVVVSKVVRMLGAIALATATVPFLGVSPAAAADSTTIAPSTTGYFYAGGIRKPDESPAA